MLLELNIFRRFLYKALENILILGPAAFCKFMSYCISGFQESRQMLAMFPQEE
jgi:hypothetical protein